jgi:hypothetical protein
VNKGCVKIYSGRGGASQQPRAQPRGQGNLCHASSATANLHLLGLRIGDLTNQLDLS